MTIDPTFVLTNCSVTTRLPSETFSVSSVHFSAGSLECIVVLCTGELIVYKLGVGQDQGVNVYKEVADPELIFLDHIPRVPHSSFFPHHILVAGRGPVVACETSNVGMTSGLYVVSDDDLIYIQVFMRHPTLMAPCSLWTCEAQLSCCALHQEPRAGLDALA